MVAIKNQMLKCRVWKSDATMLDVKTQKDVANEIGIRQGNNQHSSNGTNLTQEELAQKDQWSYWKESIWYCRGIKYWC